MKRIFSLLTFLIYLAQSAFSQCNSEDSTISRIERTLFGTNFTFKCDQISSNDKTQSTIFTGNASFKSDKFECSGAEKILYDENTKKLVVYSPKTFVFSGKASVKDIVSNAKTLEYTLGDDTVYLD
jgi:lipopolysaccharide export system protein LptA